MFGPIGGDALRPGSPGPVRPTVQCRRRPARLNRLPAGRNPSEEATGSREPPPSTPPPDPPPWPFFPAERQPPRPPDPRGARDAGLAVGQRVPSLRGVPRGAGRSTGRDLRGRLLPPGPDRESLRPR